MYSNELSFNSKRFTGLSNYVDIFFCHKIKQHRVNDSVHFSEESLRTVYNGSQNYFAFIFFKFRTY